MSMSPKYLPSPQEIRRACKRIQQEWSERERLNRMSDSTDYVPYTIPTEVRIGGRGTHGYLAKSEMDQR